MRERSNVGRRMYGESEVKDKAVRARRGVRSHFSLFGGGMERL